MFPRSARLVLGLVALAVLGTLSSGCLATAASGGISDSTHPITSNDTYVEIGPATGTAYGVMVFGIGGSEANMPGTAIQRAIDSVGGANALINVSVENRSTNLMVVTINNVRVSGTAVKITRGVAK